MSFGPERARRQQASGGSPTARIARRILLTGGCAVAGWVGASVLGASAHAATPEHVTPVDSVLSTVTGQSTSQASHDLSGVDGVVAKTTHLAGTQHITASLHHTVASVLHQRHSSITVHHHADSGAAAIDATKLTGSVDNTVTSVAKSVTKPVTQAVKPVADKVVKPITDVAQTATEPVTEPLAHKTPAPTTDLSAPVSTITGALSRSLSTGTDAISLPGVTELTAPLTHAPAPISLPALNARTGPLVKWTGVSRVLAQVTVGHHATAHRRTAAHTAVAPQQTTGTVEGPVDHAIATVVITGARTVHLSVRRHPAAPLGPLAPPVPFGVAGGSAPSTTAGSGAAGGNSPAALDSDADAPTRALDTVDPTAASMARSVAKRPSTSPD